MKRPSLFLLGLLALSLPSFAQTPQAVLSISPAVGAGTVGSPVTFDIDVNSTAGTFSLDSYEITLVPETSMGVATSNLGTATFALPAALTSTFTIQGASGDTADAVADPKVGGSNDLTITTVPTTIFTATFTPLDAGSYDLVFAPTGGDQNLYDSTPMAITFTTTPATLAVAPVPEPSVLSLAFLGLLLLPMPSSIGILRARVQ
jgi:hypothetical protein